ncbi:hypothetical protein VTL71DRAFT_3843 [Oculimacula yallundae]|uniref:C2H2-type domain-containing protein n=1 Tax=Oculimacula yallundae TaxID=86028 RepID=A0ABR4C4W2_9HELO
MSFTCPHKSCTTIFESVEELRKHGNEAHPVHGILPVLCSKDPSHLPKSTPAPTEHLELKLLLEDKSIRAEASASSEQIHPSEIRNSTSPPQTSSIPVESQSSLAEQVLLSQNEKAVMDVEQATRQASVDHCYRNDRKSTIPRTCEWKTTLRSRNLEDGLKDLSLSELLGYSSSDQESDDGFSNYSF